MSTGNKPRVLTRGGRSRVGEEEGATETTSSLHWAREGYIGASVTVARSTRFANEKAEVAVWAEVPLSDAACLENELSDLEDMLVQHAVELAGKTVYEAGLTKLQE